MDLISFGQRLRQYRQSAKLTQAELGEKAGLTPAFVGHIERGTRVLSVQSMVALCLALNITPNDLLAEFDGHCLSGIPADLSEKDRRLIVQLLNQAYSVVMKDEEEK